MTIRLLLADEQTILTDCMSSVLAMESDLEVVGVTGDGRTAVDMAEQFRPDILVTEIALPGIDGVDASHQARLRSPDTRTIILTTHGLREHVRRALLIGVNGFLLKSVTRMPTLVEAIHAVHRGGRYLTPSITTLILNDIFVKNREASPLAGLTQRERQVLRLIVEGKTSVQAAKELSLSPKTVETYRSRLTQKLGIHTLPEQVKFAIQHAVTHLN
jgi:DNA-binding NarL/FixJ family response regulator